MTDDDEKRFNDILAEEYLEMLDPERRNKHIANSVMQFKLSNWYDKSVRKDELYLVSNPKFKEAVAQARKRLRLTGAPDDDDDIYSVEFDIEVDSVIKKMGLSDEWDEYIRTYIAYGKPPENQMFYGDKYMQITRIDQDGQVWLCLKPGLRREDYVNAWKALARYLGSAQKKSKPYTSQEFNNKIYEARQGGLSYGKLAKLFFPAMDTDIAVDRIKKAVKRESQRRKKGGQN